MMKKIQHETLVRYETRTRQSLDRWSTVERRKVTTYKELQEHSILGGRIKWWALLKEYEVVGDWENDQR